MGKLIIENRHDGLSDMQALRYVESVMERGRISNHGRQYCYYTTFKDGVAVASFLNKASDRFVVGKA